MNSLESIKLIIWDLDETLWKGTISEEKVTLITDNISFIKKTLDAGIVHSICSKNTYEDIKEYLQQIEIWDFFVFSSIDWSSKGNRIKKIIQNMNLRTVNVLFIDDNVQNLKEAEYYCPGIKTLHVSELPSLWNQAKNLRKKDLQHKRLNQYKILEKKYQASSFFNNNDDFLMSCNIRVKIENDCLKHVDRIYELIMRSNQLNYTKFRQDKENLKKMLMDKKVKSGYVTAKDNYGDYGIVGFFAIKNHKAIHYLFSCRTLGMLIEQYIYVKLHCPEIVISGEVVTKLNNKYVPKWINNDINRTTYKLAKERLDGSVLFKGPCDLLQIFSFIKETKNIVTEFTYTNDKGILIEGHNHTGTIVTALTSSEAEKQEMLSQLSWLDQKIFQTTLGKEKYDYIFLSMLTDCNLGIYRNKKNGKFISLCEAYYDLTDERNWGDYINGNIYNSNIKMDVHLLSNFKRNYEFINNDDAKQSIDNLSIIYNLIDKNSKLVLLLGSEIENPKDNRDSYRNRHIKHKIFNREIEKWAQSKQNVSVINLSNFINTPDDYVDSINHFRKKIYFELANKVVKIMEKDNVNVKMYGKSKIVIESLFSILKRLIKK